MKYIKNNIMIIIGIVSGLFSCLYIKAVTEINGSIVLYNNSQTNAVNVEDAVNELYSKAYSGTASASEIYTGKTALVGGKTTTGTMLDKGAVTSSLNAGGSYTIPAGYHNGSGKVTANSLSGQTSATATASQIYTGKTGWVNGNKITGTMTDNGALNKTLSVGQTYTVPAGYTSGGTVTVNNVGFAMCSLMNDWYHGLGDSKSVILDSVASQYLQVVGSSGSTNADTRRYVQYKVLKNCTIDYLSFWLGRDLGRTTMQVMHNSTKLFESTTEQGSGTINAKANDTITYYSSNSTLEADQLLLRVRV